MTKQLESVEQTEEQREFQRLVDIIAALRNPNGGCPWDIEQTHESLTAYLIEEAYEAVDSIESGDGKLEEELGDVLLQVLLHSQIASESAEFTIGSVVKTLNEKLIRRHPHVFGNTEAATVQKVLTNWELVKAEEKKLEGSEKRGLLSGLPQSLPALQRAHRIGEKVARVGFDWRDAIEVFEKVREELVELEQELHKEKQDLSRERVEEEFGDFLFSLAQFARILGLNAEEVLRDANRKFQSRFEELEKLCSYSPEKLQRAELESLWEKVKKLEKLNK